MKEFLILLVLNLSSVVSTGGALFMAINGIRGWGWFLITGIILAMVPNECGEDDSPVNIRVMSFDEMHEDLQKKIKEMEEKSSE